MITPDQCSMGSFWGLAGMSGNHAQLTFQKSKSLQGVISGIPRSRVADLNNPDPERPLAPAFRVSWIYDLSTSFRWANHSNPNIPLVSFFVLSKHVQQITCLIQLPGSAKRSWWGQKDSGRVAYWSGQAAETASAGGGYLAQQAR